MKTFVSILFVLGFMSTGFVQAAPLTEAAAKEKASAEVKKVAESGKVDADWATAPVTKVSQRSKGKEWIVQFTRANAADPSKKNLYVILAESGEVKAVNYKGLVKAHSHGSGPAHSH